MMPHSTTLIRHAAPGQVHPDTLGTESFWAQPIHQRAAAGCPGVIIVYGVLGAPKP